MHYEDIDLTNGYVGDSNKILSFANGIFLKKGECALIYTYIKGEIEDKKECKAIRVTAFKHIFEKDPGEGDSVIIFDFDKQLILDIAYWIQ